MKLDATEVESILERIESFMDELGELGVDASVLLCTYENENGLFALHRAGTGNPYTQDGMLNQIADTNLAQTIALESCPTVLIQDNGGDDDWKSVSVED